jgi:hypothetical protein
LESVSFYQRDGSFMMGYSGFLEDGGFEVDVIQHRGKIENILSRPIAASIGVALSASMSSRGSGSGLVTLKPNSIFITSS